MDKSGGYARWMWLRRWACRSARDGRLPWWKACTSARRAEFHVRCHEPWSPGAKAHSGAGTRPVVRRCVGRQRSEPCLCEGPSTQILTDLAEETAIHGTAFCAVAARATPRPAQCLVLFFFVCTRNGHPSSPNAGLADNLPFATTAFSSNFLVRLCLRVGRRHSARRRVNGIRWLLERVPAF